MTRTQMTMALAVVVLSLFSFSVHAQQCTIVYSLNGLSHQSFNQQVNQLNPHLLRKEIRLIDMNTWQTELPHLPISGRERAKLRKQYVMPKTENSAVLLNKSNEVIDRYENTVDLVDIILSCTKDSGSQEAAGQVANR